MDSCADRAPFFHHDLLNVQRTLFVTILVTAIILNIAILAADGPYLYNENPLYVLM